MMKLKVLLATFLLCNAIFLFAQNGPQEKPKEKSMEIYGFIMMDAGYNANQLQHLPPGQV